MNEPLDELYLTWLYGQIGSVKLRNKSRTYWSLARQLFKKEFVWIVPNDDNRVEDGKDLRHEFIRENNLEEEDVDPDWLRQGCSVLEMLIALSRRVAFEVEGDPREWFWRFIRNLGLLHSTDRLYDEQHEREIDDVIERLIWRNYAYDGRDGLFPLEQADRDQRDVEIWYQASAYLMERY